MDLAIDIGGTKTFVATFDEESLVPHEIFQFLTESHRGFEDFLRRLTETGKKLLVGDQPNLWCISTAGVVDDDGNVLWSPNLGWKNLPLKQAVSRFFGDKGFVENDCNAAAYAEAWVRGSKNLAYVTVSTGIGMGLVLEGKVYRGSHYAAGEIGHTIVDEEGPVCSCGRKGCLQAISSGRGLENLIQSITGERLRCEDIFEKARTGLEPYFQVVFRGAKVLARFLTNIVDALDIEVLVLGGGLTRNEFYRNVLVEYVQRNYYATPSKKISVELPQVQPNPGAVGVLLLSRQRFGGTV
jgi:predicted NBD/HSP70 family sugar kinase